MTQIKKIAVALLAVVLCLSLCSCGSGLSGEYIDDTGENSIIFKSNGTCKLYVGDYVLDGEYEKTKTGYQIKICTENNCYRYAIGTDGDDLISKDLRGYSTKIGTKFTKK